MSQKQDSVPLFTSYSDLYYWTRDSTKPIVIHQGGTSSGKTYAIMQNLCRLAIEKNRIIHVVGQDAPNLYRGAITDFKRLLADSPILRATIKNPDLDRGAFKFKNGSSLHFITAQTSQDAKSGKRDILFINEANGISYDVAFELMARTTEQVFIDYNPNARFWVHHELVGRPDVQFIVSNFSHNPHCPKNIQNQIISWKLKAEESQTTFWKNKWRVYGLGLTGVVEGVVFDNVNECDLFPLAAKHVTYGLDFGFTNNYTALSKIGVYNDALYAKEMLYEQRLNAVDMPNRLLSIGITKQDKIIADPANDEAITTLQKKGFNVFPARKGQDSIKAGIELIQSMPLYITKDSFNWWVEVENYKYKKDKNGKFTNTPIDDYNDLWDATRYVYTELFGVRLARAKKSGGGGYQRRIARVS